MQRRYWNYLADDDTFDMIWSLVGILPYGPYIGWEFVQVGALTFRLGADAAKQLKTKEDGLEADPMSILITKQGIIITEDADAPGTALPVSAGHVSFPRIDAIICTHQYVDSAGGAEAVYSVLEGSPATTPAAPTLDPTQNLIGTLLVPAGMTNLSEATYTRARVPNFGQDDTIPHTDLENVFTKLNSFLGISQQVKYIYYDDGDFLRLDQTDAPGAAVDPKANLFILGPSISPDYKLILDIVAGYAIQPGKIIEIFTFQRMMISSSGNFILPGNNPIYVNEFEVIKFMYVGGLAPYYTGTSLWMYMGGAEAQRNVHNKFRKMVSFNKGLGGGGFVVDASKLAAIDNTGNYFQGTLTGSEFNFIRSLNISADGSSEQGTPIWLELTSISLVNAKIVHLASSPPAGYKPILLQNDQDLVFDGNHAMIHLVEKSAAYTLVSVQSATKLTDLELESGFAATGGAKWERRDGRVWLSGSVTKTGASIGTGGEIFATIGSEWGQPLRLIIQPVMVVESTAVHFGQLLINTDGEMSIRVPGGATGTTNPTIALDGVVFDLRA